MDNNLMFATVALFFVVIFTMRILFDIVLIHAASIANKSYASPAYRWVLTALAWAAFFYYFCKI